jgi:hypothetical protein
MLVFACHNCPENGCFLTSLDQLDRQTVVPGESGQQVVDIGILTG